LPRVVLALATLIELLEAAEHLWKPPRRETARWCIGCCRDLNDASSASHLRQIAITKASVTSYAESQSLINLPCTALQGRSTRPLSGIPYLEGCSKKDQD
jgi:hypothetical protein